MAVHERRRRGEAGAAGALCGQPPPADAGIVSAAKAWPPAVAVGGTLVFLLAFLAALPFLLVLAFVVTLCEALRDLLALDEYVTRGEEGRDDEVLLVLPGTCCYIFWQLGMVQYLCEQFDTRGVRLAGVSSGAICAAFVLALERAAEGADSTAEAVSRVRGRAHEIFQLVEGRMAPVVGWPMSFLGRLGAVLDAVAAEVIPKDAQPPGDRVRVGLRRFAYGLVPAMVPDCVTGFRSQADFVEAVKASSIVWLVVRPTPMARVAAKGASCSDGVNVFSFWCLLEYRRHVRSGLAARTAPEHTHSGGYSLDRMWAVWNCSVMRPLLPRRGRHLWVTPTVGGRLNPLLALRVSGWFAAEQWRQGYQHARDLDADGYWGSLTRRPTA